MDVEISNFVIRSPRSVFSQWRLSPSAVKAMQAVREGPWSSLSCSKKAILGVGLGATIGYVFYRHFRSGSEQQERREEFVVMVPQEVFNSIAHHQRSFLDLVHQQSGAQVTELAVARGQSVVCVLLQGTAEQVWLARCLLDKLAADSEVITDDVDVPRTVLGHITGFGGETLRLMCQTSGALVSCCREGNLGLGEKAVVSIRGTRTQVQAARAMIMAKITENAELHRRISQSSVLRPKRTAFPLGGKWGGRRKVLSPCGARPDLHPANTMLVNLDGTETCAKEGSKPEGGGLVHLAVPSTPGVAKFEIPSPDLSFHPDELLEVFVSAAESPQHFWIQMVGERALLLDKLTTEMGFFYSQSGPSTAGEVVVGDIVAAPYRDHKTWNRAQVLGLQDSGLVSLYYVDFGDSGEAPPQNLRSMRSDFLSLPFQAIECSLAGVSPAGESWTESALNDFHRLTYCGQWSPLLAKLHSYSLCGLSTWPRIQLFDSSHDTVLDVGEELVQLGHAAGKQTGKPFHTAEGCSLVLEIGTEQH